MSAQLGVEIANKTIRELVLEFSDATRLFEELGIDYCCGGQKPLSEACTGAQIPVEQVVEKLEAARAKASKSTAGQDWQTVALSVLIDHIVSTHHAYLKQELPRLEKLTAKVVSVHGQNHPELHEIQNVFQLLSGELSAHLMKEEQILFPYITQTEQGMAPHSCFGTIESPIAMMEYEHESAGEALRQLRRLSQDYTAPADACTSFQTLYQALKAMEADLHQHIHLENNILFPRALAMD